MKKINLFVVILFFSFCLNAQTTSTFENLTLPVDTYWTGSDLSGGFACGNVYFRNVYDTSFGGYWSDGFIYTDKTDSTTPGYTNPASSITGSGYGGSQKYAVAYDAGYGRVKVIPTGKAAGKILEGVYVTNTTYAYLSMKHGDAFEHAFTSDSSDFLLLQIAGWKNGTALPNTTSFYLANFLSSPGYIVNTWQYVSLYGLGEADSLIFSLASSQTGTPTYFALDNFVTGDIGFIQDTLMYNQDTLINVLAGFPDTTSGGPFTVSIVGNAIPGASVAVDSANLIFYIPQQGVVGWDTITYAICNASNQCDTGQIIINVTGLTGITEINTLETTVYPNPCNNTFSVQHGAGVKFIDLYDMTGRLMREVRCSETELTTRMRSDDLPTGVYLVKVISDKGVGITRISRQ